MERSPFEELVRRALLDVNYQEFEQIVTEADEIAYTPSPRHLVWEHKFLAAPFDYAKKHARPMWQRFLRAAACVLLAVSVAFGGVMAVSPTARAWVQQIFAEWFGDHARFSFGGNAGQETGEWKTTWLPEGFELVEESNLGNMVTIIYNNADGMQILFTYAPGFETIFGTDSEHQTCEEIMLKGSKAYLLRSSSPEKPTSLVWTDATNGVAFKLISEIDPDGLVKVAEHIVKKTF